MSSHQSIHPARETLAAYGLGKLPVSEAVTVESHIAECDTCCETLLDLGSDTFTDLVRRSDAVEVESVTGQGTVGLDGSETETVGAPPDELSTHPRYRVLELLGRGGMGAVFKAEHTLMNRSVALKVISRDLVQNSQAVERFRREVQSAAQLAHPNIVTAYDAEQAEDLHFLVMEYVPGEDLSEVVKRKGPLDIFQACDYIQQAANGLQHAHEEGMVHRDIKPHNLVVTRDGTTVKILDFGLATLTTEAVTGEEHVGPAPETPAASKAHRLTTLGTMMGTPDFISPEQANDPHDADIRSDIYSLGCTFYYLLTGRPPFAEGSALDRIKAHGELVPEPIEMVRGDIPRELAQVVRRMMAKDPDERFQTPAEVAGALAPFVDTPSAKRRVPTRTRTEASRRWWPPTIAHSIACAICSVVLAAIVYVATDTGTLAIESEYDDVEVFIYSTSSDSQEENGSATQMRIVDTLTGAAVKRLRSGKYVLDLKGDNNDFELNQSQFVLKRGDEVVVRVSHKKAKDSFAQAIGSINEGQTVTWEIAWYNRIYSVDGKRTWLRAEPRWVRSYLAPNRWRDVRYNKDGTIARVTIENTATGKVLHLDMKKKEAMLKNEPSGQFGPGKPFGHIARILESKSIEFAGQRDLDGVRVNVFRHYRELPHSDGESIEMWLDSETRRLVGYCTARGDDYFDPTTAPDRDNPAEERFSKGTIAGAISRDIVFDAQLDLSLFSLTPPEGFTIVEPPQRPKVDEDQMVEWLRLSARANDGVFTELDRGLFNIEWHNAIAKKAQSNRSEPERQYMNVARRHMLDGNHVPVREFVDEFAEAGSFRYLGKGIGLDDSDRIVCFYKLKSTGKYRAVYGDLRVAEIDPKKLPLPVD